MGMIRIKDLCFSYDHSKDVLKHINLSIGKGRIIVLLGPNGSGKTTLLKCINAIVKPTSGHIYVNGTDMSCMKRHEIAQRISYVPQDHKTSFPYTVLEFILLGRAPYIGIFSVPGRKDIERCNEVLDSLEIHNLSDSLYTEISGGERKLVMIARALSASPEILLLDEPTAHLDIKHQAEVLRVIKTMVRDRGTTVLMTLHDPNLATLIANRVMLLRDGELLNEGNPKEIITRDNIKRIYDCEVLTFAYQDMVFIYPET
ncbi:MAG: ABC transporter ATP-binding protein [Syntrophales bacterium]|nr:ABC transporter ATP-binding protein [Syntrophales bacterium]